tara:strand:+ start:830 stop:1327 length:498 start_codon:yes stop_codon:yes gene_type:complete
MKKPKLTLVKGKRKKTARLTAKQSKFIDAILGIGVDKEHTYTDAYKLAYETSNSSDSTIRHSAHSLFHNPNITPIYEERKRQIEERNRTLALGRSDRIITRLEEEASDFENGSPTSRVRALELLGKLKETQLFNTSVSVEDSREPEEIKQELEKKLNLILGNDPT